MRDTSKEPRCDFLLSNSRSASALNAEWEAHALDQYIVASAVMMLRTCVKWNPRTPKDVQVWCQTLGNMFGGGRQSFREHLAEGHAAAASCQVDFKKKSLAKESCGKGWCSYHNRRFNHVQLQFLDQAQSCIGLFVRVEAST